MESYGVTIHMKALWLHFCIVIIISYDFTKAKLGFLANFTFSGVGSKEVNKPR